MVCEEESGCCECRMKDKIEMITDEVCGKIHLHCDQANRTLLWKTLMPYSVGTISIFFSQGCNLMEVFINDKLTLTLEKGQTKSITMPGLKKIEVRCKGDSGQHCKGKYNLSVHYKTLMDHPQKSANYLK